MHSNLRMYCVLKKCTEFYFAFILLFVIILFLIMNGDKILVCFKEFELA
jgi:hypothetical protein